MGTIYILGAGFSKSCDIATDFEMLDALNPYLKRDPQPKDAGSVKTTIEYLREQNFPNDEKVGFELFMSTLSALKFSSEYLKLDRKIFQEEEEELQKALCMYLESSVSKVNWEDKGKTVLQFMRQVDWKRDFILTFNYDLLLETAAKRLNLNVKKRIIHLHGAIGERVMAWPTYTKFAHRTTKAPLELRWKRAFNILRGQLPGQSKIDKMVFIGYSMPLTDLEAKSLFNYTDLCNSDYSYPIIVVNPSKRQIKPHYKFFRKKLRFIPLTIQDLIENQG
jgi:hypothetical protein